MVKIWKESEIIATASVVLIKNCSSINNDIIEVDEYDEELHEKIDDSEPQSDVIEKQSI